MMPSKSSISPRNVLLFTLVGALASTTTAQNPPCYICGGDEGATLNGGIEIPSSLIPPEFQDDLGGITLTCGLADTAGRGGLIPPEQCDQLVNDLGDVLLVL